MSFLPLVDEIYESFARSLPPTLARAAQGLASTLQLVPEAGIPWSNVFRHEVVLAAPALFSDAVPDVASRIVREATRAHLLGILHAFATDRVLDGEAKATASTLALLDAMRDARDAALAIVLASTPDERATSVSVAGRQLSAFRDAETNEAVAKERAVLALKEEVAFAEYAELSRRKQSAAAPGSVALALAAGWDDARTEQVKDLFETLALGLQMYDDAVDWPQDLTRGTSWAASLVGAAGLPESEARSTIRQSGILFRLVDTGRAEFEKGEAIARELSAIAIADWARERRVALARVAAEEARSPGYAAREQALGGWVHEVLR